MNSFLMTLAMAAAPASGEAPQAPSIMDMVLPIGLMFLIVYFLILRPQQKKADDQKKLVTNLKKGDYIVTLSGIYGRVIEVEKGQKVISSGPYAIVRHPLYVSGIGLYLCTPLVLASYWAAIPGALIIPILIVRILNEEKVLTKELPGYEEYIRKVRHRLIPGIW